MKKPRMREKKRSGILLQKDVSERGLVLSRQAAGRAADWEKGLRRCNIFWRDRQLDEVSTVTSIKNTFRANLIYDSNKKRTNQNIFLIYIEKIVL